MQKDQQKRNQIRANRLKLKLAIKGSVQLTKNNGKIEKISTSIQIKDQLLKKQEKVNELNELNSPILGDNVIYDKQLSELFQVKERIGAGSQSIVHRCIEKTTGKEFAVKIIKKCGAQILNNIKEIYKLMKQFNHPNIIKVKNLFIEKEKERCQIVIEYFHCSDLRAYMRDLKKSGNKIEESQAIKIIQSILQALNQFKQKRVCHRDIKPENILYDPKTGIVKIIDFEVARINRNSEEPMDLWTDAGSLYYRAPESFAGGYDEKVDTWAAGVIAYEILLGHLPFFNEHKQTVKKMIRQQELQIKQQNISETGKNFIFGLLNKDRQHRLAPKEALAHPYLNTLKENLEQYLSSTVSIYSDQSDQNKIQNMELGFLIKRRMTLPPTL